MTRERWAALGFAGAGALREALRKRRAAFTQSLPGRQAERVAAAAADSLSEPSQ